MKKIIYNLSLGFLLVLSLMFMGPLNSYAATDDFLNINDITAKEVDNLTFSNITFKDYSLTSTNAFGLTGNLVNSSADTVSYHLKITFFDAFYKPLFSKESDEIALAGSSDFNQMYNSQSLGNYRVSDIKYYRLEVTTLDANILPLEDDLKPSHDTKYNSYDYVIDKYDVDIMVNEDNTLDATETITAYFRVPKHGIFRTIPLRNKLKRYDGTTAYPRTKVSKVSVNSEFKTSIENDNYKIQIGSAEKTLTGEQNYVLKYHYNLGKDREKAYDELYFNIIGNEWDTVIGNITFKITMPKDFDSSKLGFSSGALNATDNDKIKFNVSNNQIIGFYTDILEANQAITVRCELADGYFQVAGFSTFYYLLYLLPIIFLGISWFLWYKFGRLEGVVETVEFYPPTGVNSLEAGFLYNGQANNKDVTSLLIYLANQGYLKITETENKSLLFKSKGFKITKLKEYDGNNKNEKVFFDGLFTKKPTINLFGPQKTNIDNPNEVTEMDLYDNFYITMNKILSDVNRKENREKVFDKTASSKKKYILFMLIIAFLIINILPILDYGETLILLLAGPLFTGLGLMVIFTIGFSNSNIGLRIFGVIFGLIFGGVPWYFFVLPYLKENPIYLIGYFLGLICLSGMAFFLQNIKKRTPYGNEMLGKLRGFKNFLETAEKSKLEALVMEDATYFYNILPYTYVLGVSEKWIKKFEAISLQAPTWYEGEAAFNFLTFSAFLDSTMSSAQNAMVSSPSSSSGSSSSGGGVSGGGFGGGGGGSW